MAEHSWGVSASNLLIRREAGSGGAPFELQVPEFVISASRQQNRLPILGPSGSGKSTLMNGLAAISLPSHAESKVRWRFPDGQVVEWGARGPSSVDALRLRRNYFGFAFQNAALQPHLTIGANLVNFLMLTGVPRSEARDRSRRMLQSVIRDRSWEDLFDRYFSEISGGQRQRVALVQSMIHDPCVLFADEPTGSLDEETRRVVMKVLTDWVDRDPDRRLLVWVTHHRTDPADNHASQRIWVEAGRCGREVWSAVRQTWEPAAMLEAGVG